MTQSMRVEMRDWGYYSHEPLEVSLDKRLRSRCGMLSCTDNNDHYEYAAKMIFKLIVVIHVSRDSVS